MAQGTTKWVPIDVDDTLSANSDVLVPSQKAVKTYVDALTATDLWLGNVDNTSDSAKPISTATQTALDWKVDENVAILWATKTKITYDSKGLVTVWEDATTADIADSLNKRYVTDANLTVIGNTSWTNTGDQTSIVWITGTLAEFNTALTGADFATLAWIEALTNKSVNWVTLVNWWTTTKYLSEDGTYTTPAWWSWGWFWTAVPWSPTRTGNTTFTLTDTSNANLYDLLLCRWTVLKRTESSTLRQAMVVSATYSTNVVTVTIIWDTMTSIDASSLKYGLEKARTRRFAIAGTIGATGTNVANTVMVETPAKVYWCDFWAGTAGSGTTTLDINKWWTTMFTTKPSILTTGQNILWVTADTATTATTGDYITIDIDATAGTTKIIDAYVNLYRYPLYSYYLS